ncbi:hypothetical protein ACFU90_20470 [Streptomyces noursei]|uniref:Uncharacterized protein n=1 Tax=Streptomyces noursei TaxID=1971 RepID=A0A059WAY8_STRNR|nr:hypothetical protein [Streptomyces noursei]AKA05112.1 hypothetical protein SAZ_23650 [Streptomyces noursei ZPM]AIA04931.1 hypothetical protein DC74_4451 [Streptomyces noursei]EOT00366.1 hypothetical protein K530_29231 [Streptomyces noursei CCRC 11814]MCZ0974046.1 hypothetical protein [Streptomyces noursei]UWS73497.1 hypothetical protein N1H47_20965 [Streptomyces noursei]
MNALKALLWCVLTLAVAVNVSTSFVFDGVQQVLLSVGTGTVVLACVAALLLLRARRRP